MSSSESSTPDHMSQPRTVVPNLYISDPAAADEMDLSDHFWMVSTVIEDDDLMFGGKPLCAWYEEDRRRLSSIMDEEETRGRPRERVSPDTSGHQKAHQHYQHQHQPQHQRHRSKMAKDTKE